MRTTYFLAIITSFATGCMGEIGGPRKPDKGSDAVPSTDSPCTKVEKNVTIRVASDALLLPQTGCYDIVGSLTIQSSDVTSLAKLADLNSVTDLELDHTSLTHIDTKRTIGIYGKLTVVGNPQLTTLGQLLFKTASPGILIDGNAQLRAIEPVAVDTAQLTEVDGDVTITGNPVLGAVAFKHLTKISGKLLVGNNPALTSLDLGQLQITSGIEISDNLFLTQVTGLAMTTIAGDLAIRNNAALTSLGTMTALYHVAGDVTIENNARLASLAAFTTALKQIDHALTINNNASLTDVGSLKYVSHISAITILNNLNLVACRALEIDRCVNHDQGSNINNNRNANCGINCN